MNTADGDGLVSVVIPTYDRLPFLREAIESVLRQTYAEWELIVVDDGSTDGTDGYVGGLADGRVGLVRSEHTGCPAVVRNLGLRRARGRFVAFLDSDDVWHHRKLEIQLSRCHGERDFAWSYTNFALVDTTGVEIPFRVGGPWTPCEGFILPEVITREATIAPSTVVVERSLLEEVDGFDESLQSREDYDLWLRLAAKRPAGVVRDRLCVIRDHAERGTETLPDSNRWMLVVYRKLMETPAPRNVVRLAARQYAYEMVESANRHVMAGRLWEALKELVRSLRYRLAYRRRWIVFAKLILFRLPRIARALGYTAPPTRASRAP